MNKRFAFTVSVSWIALLSLSYFSLSWAQPTKLTVVTNLRDQERQPAFRLAMPRQTIYHDAAANSLHEL